MLATLVMDSEAQGVRFVRRLVDEWATGVNRFDQPGEALFVARRAGAVVGVCGLNIDPYVGRDGERRVGRVRHLYVVSTHRRLGIGDRLLGEVLAAARGVFELVRLRTGNPAAAALYERHGFRPTGGEPHCTHIIAVDGRCFYAGLRAAGQIVHLKLVDTPDPSIDFVDAGEHFHLYLETDDATAAAERLRANGVRLVKALHDTDWGTREFAIKDDQGHTLYFGERREVP